MKGMPTNGRGGGNIAEGGSSTGETSSMKLTREFQAALEEGERARGRNTLDESESMVSWRAKRSTRRAMMAEKAEKARGSALGLGALRAKRAGVTKNKKAAKKQKGYRAKSGMEDTVMLDGTNFPAGGSTDTSMKDPSPSSGDVSMGGMSGNSPSSGDVSMGGMSGNSLEDRIRGKKAGTQKGISAMGMVRGIGRHIGIFVAAVQDSTEDLRKSGEYKAWRDFFGEL